MAETLAGRVLVAGPRLIDPNFARTVVLIAAHDDEGALGLVLNRATDIPVGDHLPGWVERLTTPEVVFVGGPVQPETAIGLARRIGAEPPGWTEVSGTLGMIDLSVPPSEVAGSIEALRVYSGYAGWVGGQLEAEIAGDDWLIADLDASDPFRPDPEILWRSVLRRSGGRAALYAHFPVDPRAN